jgi:PRTRC genetic system protein F
METFAQNLARCDVLQPGHWGGRSRAGRTLCEQFGGLEEIGAKPRLKADALISASCEAALRDFSFRHRPQPLAKLGINFTDKEEQLSDGYSGLEHYKERHKLPAVPEHIGTFIVYVDGEDPCIRELGQVLKALEDRYPRLGQTVMAVLHEGLSASTRGIDPVSGIWWTSQCYWMGEEDETERVAEEFGCLEHQYDELSAKAKKDKVKPTPADVEIFRKADYEKAIPPKFGTEIGKPLSRAVLSQLHRDKPAALRPFQNILHATIALMDRCTRVRRGDGPDNGMFDNVSWDVVPFILRWSSDDCLTQIFDDVMNDIYQSGETICDVNAVFAFHDLPTMRRAIVRLGKYLEILQLCETLLLHLGNKEAVRIQVPVQIPVTV